MVVKGAKEPIILLSTDITLTAIQIIEIYGSRFSIELAIRDLKQQFGLGDYQCYLGIAIDRFVQLACVAYCLFRLFQIKEIEQSWMPKVRLRFRRSVFPAYAEDYNILRSPKCLDKSPLLKRT